MGLFLNIEGAFNCNSVESIEAALDRHGLASTSIRWVCNTLTSRLLTVNRGEGTLKVVVRRGCPRGGVLSPLLWCLVVNGLLERLNGEGIYTKKYADDITVVVRAMDTNTASSLAQDALRKVGRWCREVGLSVNPEKTVIVIFTRKRKLDGCNDYSFQGRQVRRKEVVKHLGVTLDAKLNCGPQMERVSREACAILWAMRQACGITWGLTPRMLHWLYTAMVKPVILHGAVVWWRRTRLKRA